MNLLCICAYGHSRSVCLARLFHGMGYNAISIGYGTSGSGLSVLTEWADYIMIVDQNASPHIPQQHIHKCKNFDVGPDVWQNPYNKELRAKFELLVKEQTPELWKNPS